MLRRRFLTLLAASPQELVKPNIVLIVSDDHGYADISCYAHPPEVATPHIDRLARGGVRFTQGYANAYVCAPTRAGLLTGRYPQRYGFYTGGDSRAGLPLEEITLAQLLRKHGYATGAFGKWHLGIAPEYHPLERGFDTFYGFLGHGAHDYFDLKPSTPHNSIYRDRQIISDTGYLTDNLAREATAFIEKQHARPFFLYLAFNAVHAPLQAPEQDIRRYATGRRNRDIYLAMLDRMDQGFGKVLDALDRWRLSEKTLVIFLSDNGGARNNAAHNGGLRDYKHSVYEGGIRVPFLLRWPGKAPAGRTVSEPVLSLDIFPTAAAAAGAALPSDRVIDGKNLLRLFEPEFRPPLHEALFWDGDEGRQAVRAGRWKLVMQGRRKELFDLESDPGEKVNLIEQHPEPARRLEAQFQQWRRQMAPRLRRPPEQA